MKIQTKCSQPLVYNTILTKKIRNGANNEETVFCFENCSDLLSEKNVNKRNVFK